MFDRLESAMSFCRFRHVRTLVVLAACAWALSGCMLSPGDGEVLDQHTSIIHFGGVTHKAHQEVVLEVGVPRARTGAITWTELDRTVTYARPSSTLDGVDLFRWDILQVLPPETWTRGVSGRFAVVRMRVPELDESEPDVSLMFTFSPEWRSCFEAHPGLLDFISNCKSPHKSLAYIYTRDYPLGVDLEVTSVVSTPATDWFPGSTEVRVRNGGRHGTVSNLTCSRPGASGTVTIDQPMLPGETRSFFHTLTARRERLTCAVVGTNEDGSAEANTRNNQGYVDPRLIQL